MSRPLRLLLLATAFLLTGVASAQAVPWVSWSFGALQTSAGNYSGDPVAIGYDRAGNATTAYPDGTTIDVATRAAGPNLFSAPSVAGHTSGTIDGVPLLAENPAGDVAVAWVDEDATDGTTKAATAAVWVATRPAEQATFDAAIQVTPTGDDPTSPALFLGADGTTTVVWLGDAGHDRQVDGQTVRVATRYGLGGPFGATADLSREAAGNFASGSNAAGTIALAWTETVHGGVTDSERSVVTKRMAGYPSFTTIQYIDAFGPEAGSPVPGPATVAVAPDGSATTTLVSRDPSTGVNSTHAYSSGPTYNWGASPVGSSFPAEASTDPRDGDIIASAYDAAGHLTVAGIFDGDPTGTGYTYGIWASTDGGPVEHVSGVAPIIGDVVLAGDGAGGMHLMWGQQERYDTHQTPTLHYAYRPPYTPSTTPESANPARFKVVPDVDFSPGLTHATLAPSPFGDATISIGSNMVTIDLAGPAASAITGPSDIPINTVGHYSITATDPFASPVTIHWDFGDGGTADGSDVVHTFTTPTAGTANGVHGYFVSVTLTDTFGNVTKRSTYVQATKQFPAIVKQPVLIKPVLALALSRSKFPVVPGAKSALDHGAVGKTSGGAILTITASTAGTGSFLLAKSVAGHRAGKSCHAGGTSKAHPKHCEAFKDIKKTATLNLAAGKSTVRVTGRWGRAALSPGLYRLTGYLVSGPQSKPATVAFRITR